MNSSKTYSGQRSQERMKIETNQDYPPDQQPTGKKIKIKGSPPSKDLGQVEAITKEVGRNIIKATNLNNQERPGVRCLPGQPRRVIPIKTIVGQKEEPNPNSKKPEHMTDFPISRTGLHRYDYPTSLNHLTTPSTMAKLNQGNGSEYIHNQLN